MNVRFNRIIATGAPTNPLPVCTPDTMLVALADFLNVPTRPPENYPHSVEERGQDFAQLLRKWKKTYGVSSIQQALKGITSNGQNVFITLLGLTPQIYPSVKMPLWMCMEKLIPYLATSDGELASSAQGVASTTKLKLTKDSDLPFKISHSLLANPAKSIRQLIESLVATSVKGKPYTDLDYTKMLCQLIGLLATLSSKEGGHEIIQNALFYRNEKGISSFHKLFRGRDSGYQFTVSLRIVALLFAFKLDIKRFDAEHKYTFLQCFIAHVAIHSSRSIDSDSNRFTYVDILNGLMGDAIPSCLAEVPADQIPSGVGQYSRGRPQSGERWLSLSIPGQEPIVETFSWFRELLEKNPIVRHPVTEERILFSREDLCRLGIMTVVQRGGGLTMIRSMRGHTYLQPETFDRELNKFRRELLQNGLITDNDPIRIDINQVRGCGVTVGAGLSNGSVTLALSGSGLHYIRYGESFQLRHPFEAKWDGDRFYLVRNGERMMIRGETREDKVNNMVKELLKRKDS